MPPTHGELLASIRSPKLTRSHILAPSSPFADIAPGAFERTISLVQNARDEDAIVFAEIAEYARSLVPLPKGQDLSFTGLPQLLPYKLQRAWLAAELGDVDQAKRCAGWLCSDIVLTCRYCTAVETASKPGKNQPQILSPALLSSLEDLTERLTGTPSANPARLIGGRKAKAGLGSWIEGRLTKFIAGEEDALAPAKPAPAAAKDSGAPIGPFSHFSTISPAASGGPSRNLSTNDFEGNGYGRTSSSSSLYDADYTAQPAAQASYSSWSHDQETEPTADDDTPTGNDDEAEFINPMAALSLGARGTAPSDYQPPASSSHNRIEPEDDDEDMGFGNSSLSRGRTPRPAASEAVADKKSKDKDNSPAPVEEAKPEASADKRESTAGLGSLLTRSQSQGVARRMVREERWRERRSRPRQAGRGEQNGIRQRSQTMGCQGGTLASLCFDLPTDNRPNPKRHCLRRRHHRPERRQPHHRRPLVRIPADPGHHPRPHRPLRFRVAGLHRLACPDRLPLRWVLMRDLTAASDEPSRPLRTRSQPTIYRARQRRIWPECQARLRQDPLAAGHQSRRADLAPLRLMICCLDHRRRGPARQRRSPCGIGMSMF